uniref:Reverse transcriptase/retrotransposon-derived protein RNase H-like domain-containing protein n=1 Tax=Callorhinchus milii TaxID=7868 RepID=A0A4W3IYX9_CALMI
HKIPDYAQLSKPLTEMTKPTITVEPLVWTTEAEQAFDQLKTALQSAPALGIPNYEKVFNLFVHEVGGFAQAVLTQEHGGRQRPVSYFTTKLDPVASALPGCLKAVPATYYAVMQAEGLTFEGESLTQCRV